MISCHAFTGAGLRGCLILGLLLCSVRPLDAQREREPAPSPAERDLRSATSALAAKLDPEQRAAFEMAQRNWLVWARAEAVFLARYRGAIGGSALRDDANEAHDKLVQTRVQELRSLASDSPLS